MKIEGVNIRITLTNNDLKIIPSMINDLTKESKMFILILASIIIPAYVYLKTHKSSIDIKLNDTENNQILLNEEVIDND